MSPTDRPTVSWFRRDLRLDDHPALVAAAREWPVIPLFVHGVERADALARHHVARSRREFVGTEPCSSR